MKKIVLVILSITIFIANIFADAFNELNLLPTDKDGWFFNFELHNDSYWGHGSSHDRDDLRTHGFRFFGSAPYGIKFHLTWEEFTHRGVEPSEYNLNAYERLRYDIPDPGRYDLIRLGGNWEFLDYDLTDNIGISLDLTGDLELTGDLGGLFIQEVWHSIVGSARPLPSDNDEYQFTGELGISSTLSGLFLDGTYIGLDFQLDSKWHPLVTFQLGYWDHREKSSLMAEASYTAAGIWGETSSQKVVSQFEHGLNITWGFYSEFFYFSRVFNLASETFMFDQTYSSIGVIGFRFGGDMNKNLKRKGNLSFELMTQIADHPFVVRLLYQPQWFFDVSTPWLGRLSLMVFSENGYDKQVPLAIYGQWGFGFRYHMLVPEQKWSLNGYIDIGMALREISWTPRNQYRAYPGARSYGIIGEISAGMTIPIWGFKRDDTAMGSIGLVYTLNYLMSHYNDPNYGPNYELSPFSHWFGVSLLITDFNAE